MKKNEGRRGITLIALAITIVVLLILAGITINLIIGQDGIITRAEQAGGEYTNAATSEREQLTELTNRTDEIITNVTGANKPKEKIIEIELKGEKEQTTVPVNLSFEVKIDGEKITNYKWVLNSEKEEIGIEEQKYPEEVLNEENTELKISEEGTYYLHVLTTEDNGAKRETIKGPISVNICYHEHIGDSTSGTGCYITPVFHTHVNDCYTTYKCTSTSYYYWREDENKPGLNIYRCSSCGANRHEEETPSNTCNRELQKLICNKSASTIDGYILGCGKTKETIESVTMEY